jgi:hypothetical protein
LTLEVQEHRAGSPIAESKYLRRIVVEHAPALVELPCLDKDCEGGGHDVTAVVLTALASGQTHFEGHDICHGYAKTAGCQREVHYVGTVTYRAKDQ